jgi:hypothetical protein
MLCAARKLDGKIFYFQLAEHDAFPRFATISNSHTAYSYFSAPNTIFITLPTISFSL